MPRRKKAERAFKGDKSVEGRVREKFSSAWAFLNRAKIDSLSEQEHVIFKRLWPKGMQSWLEQQKKAHVKKT